MLDQLYNHSISLSLSSLFTPPSLIQALVAPWITFVPPAFFVPPARLEKESLGIVFDRGLPSPLKTKDMSTPSRLPSAATFAPGIPMRGTRPPLRPTSAAIFPCPTAAPAICRPSARDNPRAPRGSLPRGATPLHRRSLRLRQKGPAPVLRQK